MNKPPAPLLVIGVPQETLDSAKVAILAILSADCGEQTKREALRALSKACQVNASLTGCNFQGAP
jgi:hypothetical protein